VVGCWQISLPEKEAVELKARRERVLLLEHQTEELKRETLGSVSNKAQVVDKLKKDVKLQAERIVGLEGEVQWETQRIFELQADVQEEIDAHNELGAANEKQSRIEIALRDLKDEMIYKDYSLSMASQDKAAGQNKITKLENMVRDGVISINYSSAAFLVSQ
jgi:hypothetical protein